MQETHFGVKKSQKDLSYFYMGRSFYFEHRLFLCKCISEQALRGMRRHAKRENSGLLIGKANADGEYKRSAKLRKKRFAGALLRNHRLRDNAEAPDRSVTENRPQFCVRNGKIMQSGKKRTLHKQPLRYLHKSAAERPPKKLLAEKTAAFGAQIHNSGGSENRNEHRRGAEKILSMLKIVRDKARRDFEHRRKRNARQKRRKPRRFAAPFEDR